MTTPIVSNDSPARQTTGFYIDSTGVHSGGFVAAMERKLARLVEPTPEEPMTIIYRKGAIAARWKAHRSPAHKRTLRQQWAAGVVVAFRYYEETPND